MTTRADPASPRTAHASGGRVLLVAMGAAGDVLPFLELAAALHDRSHHATLLLPEPYVERARRAGLDARTLDAGWSTRDLRAHPQTLRPVSGAVEVARRLVLPRTADLATQIDAAISDHRTDAIVCHHLMAPVPRLCLARGLPYCTAALAPISWPSLADVSIYPGMPDKDDFSPIGVAIGMRIGLSVMSLRVERPLDRALRRVGLPTPASGVGHVLTREMLNGVANLGLWSPLLRPPAPDDPPRSVICGAPLGRRLDGSEPLPEAIARFLDDGEPPLVAMLGSTAAQIGGGTLDILADAARALGARIILLTADPRDARASADERVLRLNWSPLDPLLSQSAGVIHHAGMATAMRTLSHGLPALAIPFMHDQFDNATRLRRLGVARRIGRRRLTLDKAAEAIEGLLRDTALRARAENLAPRIAAEDAGGAAADAIERMIGVSAS